MLKIRIQYTKSEEMKKVLTLLEKDFEILSLTEEAKSNNPKYLNSKFKVAYAEIENNK